MVSVIHYTSLNRALRRLHRWKFNGGREIGFLIQPDPICVEIQKAEGKLADGFVPKGDGQHFGSGPSTFQFTSLARVRWNDGVGIWKTALQLSYGNNSISAAANRAYVSPASNVHPVGIVAFNLRSESRRFCSSLVMVATFQCFWSRRAISGSEWFSSLISLWHSVTSVAHGTTCSGWVGVSGPTLVDFPAKTNRSSG